MTDRRVTPDPRWVDGHQPAQVQVPVVDLLDRPDGARDRQLLFGDPVTVLGAIEDASYVRSDKDGYIGFVPASALIAITKPTHRVRVLATHVYSAPDIKSPDRMTLSFGTAVSAVSEHPGFIEISSGFIPNVHLAPVAENHSDPVAVAELFLGTPYLWGGNSRLGMDCSGLVQAAWLACGMACPGDSDQQCDQIGEHLAKDASMQRGDLLFWPGHVAIIVDSHRLIHANAHHMAVAFEPIADALARIDTAGDGPLTAHKRV